MAKITTTKTHTSGIALGGIGSGSVELLPDGEWFLRMMGLSGNLSDDRVGEVIEFIFRNNFDKEQGLVNATVPEGKKTTIHTYKNCQAGAVWTGIGYAFSALALRVGLSEISDTVVSSIHSNQLRLGHFWDHWECGHHYTRPMASWSTLNAVSGLSVDYENRKLSLAPAYRNVTFLLLFPIFLLRWKLPTANAMLRALKVI